jgi:microcystin degradation protein MlrC
MKVFTASLGTETNTFSPIPTGLSMFKETFYVEAGQHPNEPMLFTGPLWAARQRAKERNWQVVEGLCTFAQPAGVTVRKVYEELRDKILAQLGAALPVDMVVIGMHGAMVADGYDDCEGDLLERIRKIVGPDVAVGAELDPHCHITKKMTDNATAIICFKEYPHIDFVERGLELVDICADAAMRKTRPKTATFDCRTVGVFHTPIEPMKSFVAKMKAHEGKDGILSVSFGHGFPWGDVPDMGAKILVIADGDQAKAARLAESLGRELYALRGKTTPPLLSNEAGLDRAMATAGGPIVLADSPDNPGGGAPCDSTYVLAEILRRGITGVALGPMWDPMAVKTCFEVGEGARLDLRIGGKTCRYSGAPVDLEVEVTKLVRDARQTFGKAKAPLGDAATIRAKGIEIVLTSIRGQAFGTDLFTGLGVDLASKKLIVVKSSQHFYASFAPIAKEVLYLDGPGTMGRDMATFDFRKADTRQWPWVENPLG